MRLHMQSRFTQIRHPQLARGRVSMYFFSYMDLSRNNPLLKILFIFTLMLDMDQSEVVYVALELFSAGVAGVGY